MDARGKFYKSNCEMALVAYGSSDESDLEQDDTSHVRRNFNHNAIQLTINLKANGKYESNKLSIDEDESQIVVRPKRPISYSRSADDLSDDDKEDNSEPLSFGEKLSSATYHTLVDESRIPKSGRLNALFALSSQNKINDELIKKKLSLTEEKSGLLSVLPKPTSDMLEQPVAIFKNLTSSKSLPSKLIPRSIKSNTTTVQKGINDEDEDIGADFFSLTKVDSTPDVFEPVDIDSLKSSYDVQKTPARVEHERIPELQQVEDFVAYESMDYEDAASMMPGTSGISLDEDAMQKLCGRKRKGQIPDEIQVIDVFEDEILVESKQERLKRLSEEVSHQPAVKRGTGPSSLEKRKHQITYLASLAKSRELELKNMWAQNKFTKRQTQSKYGF